MLAGATVGEVATAETTPAGTAKMMVGRHVRLAAELLDGGRETGDGSAPLRGASKGSASPSLSTVTPVLAVSHLTVASSRKPNEVNDLSFEVRSGEIFGIAGVEGNGQTELIEAIAGLRKPISGTISIAGKSVADLSVRERAELGLSHIPEDRHRRGLVLDYSIGDNLILGLQHRFAGGGGVLQGERVDANATTRIREFDIRPPSTDLPARSLSGGNQQKIVIAREMRGREYSVLLASQPTRGVDVGAIEFIHEQLRNARESGKGVLLISADLVEVLSLADRVAVMYEGRIVATLARAEATQELVGEYMTGAKGTGDGGRETGVATSSPKGEGPNAGGAA